MYLLVEINIVEMTLRAALIDPIGIVRKPCPGVAGKAGKATKLKHRQHLCLFNVIDFFVKNSYSENVANSRFAWPCRIQR
jgi:hypothetical protein